MPKVALPPLAQDDAPCRMDLLPRLGSRDLQPLAADKAAARPAGPGLDTGSTAKARFLAIGIRNRTDTFHYPDHDLITHKDGHARRHTHADGRPRTHDGDAE